jgi:hypothetical protein
MKSALSFFINSKKAVDCQKIHSLTTQLGIQGEQTPERTEIL